MSVRIAISDPLPLFRQGVMASLGSAGFTSEEPDDLMAWARDEQRRVILMTLQSMEHWALLAQLCRAWPDISVVAVLEDQSAMAYVRALKAGAVGAVPRSASPESIRHVFEAVVRGASILPIEVVRMLASADQPPPHAPDTLSPREVEWLQGLASGMTVAQLAVQAGYSERAMFRLLRGLYSRIDVKSRTEALMYARERGWL
jgi:DNA-binding NarL/FixJ family response regulator